MKSSNLRKKNVVEDTSSKSEASKSSVDSDKVENTVSFVLPFHSPLWAYYLYANFLHYCSRLFVNS